MIMQVIHGDNCDYCVLYLNWFALLSSKVLWYNILGKTLELLILSWGDFMSTTLKKVLFAICIIIILVFSSFMVLPGKLNADDRIEDFEYLCNTIEGALQQLNEYERLYDINYYAEKETYLDLIKSCENDAEFYYLLRSFVNKVPSVHTKIVFPNNNIYEALGGYNSKKIIRKNGVCKQAEYFCSAIEENAEKYSDSNLFLVNYIDGKYYFLADDYNEIIEIESINNCSADLFLQNIQSDYKIAFDHINSKAFYPAVIFNDKYGENAIIKGHYIDGDEVELDLYYSVFVSDVISFTERDYENRKVKVSENDSSDSYMLSVDMKNDISYVAINSLDYELSEEIKGKINAAAQAKNIIIDLRGNAGGNTRTEIVSVFVPLLSDRFIFNNSFNFPVNKYTEYITPEIAQGDLLINEDIEINGNSGVFSEEYFVYGEADEKHDLYILIDYDTISAGDEFASIVKEYELGTLIGNNTAGEGRVGSYLTGVLPNSRLVFNYSFGQNCIDGEKDNSVYGTAPDICICNGIDEYIKKLSISNPLTYENRLEWDCILKETVELIKEKENDNLS